MRSQHWSRAVPSVRAAIGAVWTTARIHRAPATSLENPGQAEHRVRAPRRNRRLRHWPAETSPKPRPAFRHELVAAPRAEPASAREKIDPGISFRAGANATRAAT